MSLLEQEKEFFGIRTLGLNANVLKIIAVVSMFIDHGSRLVVEDGTISRWWMHLVGRLAMPLICYLMAEGHHYTSNKKAYVRRLFIFSLISHVPYVLYFNLSPFTATSVIWTLMLGVLALEAAANERLTDRGKIICVALCCVAAMPANWNYIGVLWIVAFGVFRDDFKKKTLAFLIIGVLFYVIPGLQDFGAFVSYRAGFMLAIPVYYLYNRQPGKRSMLSKWAFYWFYPAHLLLFLAIQYFMS